MAQPVEFRELAKDHSKAVTTTSSLVLVANRYRSFASFVNDSDAVIYLMLGNNAALNTGVRLNALGGSLEINTLNLFKGDIFAIHGGVGNKVLCIQEVETSYDK